MVEWTGSGVILSVRKHGETSAIIDVFTEEKGRHAGLVRGGVSRKWAPILQPGAQVGVSWRARLEEHLGSYQVEPLKSRATILNDRLGLAALNSATSLISFAFPERMALPGLYDATQELFDRIAAQEPWLIHYAEWEMQVLDDLGYGLDLSECAASGSDQELVYVSPKSGRAVSREGAGEYADRLRGLRPFLLGGALSGLDDIHAALHLSGHFLNLWLAPALGKAELPAARGRLLSLLHGLKSEAILN